jgi:integrase
LVDGLQPGSQFWDTAVRGFGVRRLTKDAIYLVRYRFAGRQRFVTIGRHGSPWTVDGARRKALELLGQIAGGTDPQLEKAKANAEAVRAHAETFEGMLGVYLQRKRPGMKPRSFREVQRHLMQHAKPLHVLPLGEINRRTVAGRLGEIEEHSGIVARNRVRSSLSAFFTWAVREGLVEINPVSGTGKADEGGSREHVLSNAELVAVWRACRDDAFGRIVRLLILTGQRREEVGGMRWSELRGDLWTVPPERTKNWREHQVPLVPLALSILPAKAPATSSGNVFGKGQGGFSAWSRSKERFDQRAGIAEWHLHDIRRSVATGMADLGILPHIIEAVLNHVSGHKAGVAGICNRARYAAEVRDALSRWSAHVASLTRS